jgi:hypothetical protein
MKCLLNQFIFVASVLSVVGLAGCSKSGANGQFGLDSAKIPAAMSQVFSNAPDSTKQEAASYVSALQSQDTDTAFSQLRQMINQPNLSPEQRQVIAKAMPATFLKLQAAAQNGNASAQAVMNNYLSTR